MWSPFWQMSFWHVFTTVVSSIKSFWPEAAELGSVPLHFKKSNKSIFFTKLPNSRDFCFKTGTDGLNTEMERTETLIRETRTIGLDNHLIPHRQKQLELNREGSIDVHHLFKHTHTSWKIQDSFSPLCFSLKLGRFFVWRWYLSAHPRLDLDSSSSIFVSRCWWYK